MKDSKTEDLATLLVKRSIAQKKIRVQIEKGHLMLKLKIDSEESLLEARSKQSKWHDYNIELLKRLFSSSALADEYSFIVPIAVSSGRQKSLFEHAESLMNSTRDYVERLESIEERLELMPEQGDIKKERRDYHSRKVFIVHGHDEASKQELARILEKMELEPVILHEKPNKCRALIEKLEDHTSDVGYAFILLTPDDLGKSRKRGKLRKRARENVVFEFGYLMGKLGRDRICCLYTGGVHLPSDVKGIVYEKFSKSVNEVYKRILDELREAKYEPKT
jgi:predicted nucleotide-binding protein